MLTLSKICHDGERKALKGITGLTQMTLPEMDRVSQGMIEGFANYTGDPEGGHTATIAHFRLMRISGIALLAVLKTMICP